MPAYLNAIACSVPPHESQAGFLDSLDTWAGPPDVVDKLRKIAAGSQIAPEFIPLGNARQGIGYRFAVYQQNAFVAVPNFGQIALEHGQ